MSADKLQKADITKIKQALSILYRSGDVVELRALDVVGKTNAGYFNDFDLLAKEAGRLSGQAAGVYVVLNQVNPDLLARSQNRITISPKNLTQDADIIRRRWLPIDVDAIRPSGISSTDQEHEAALVTAEAIRTCLIEHNFPVDSILMGDSGNGAHVLIHIDLPNDSEAETVVKAVLKSLAVRFNNNKVSIDLSVFNAARIWKVPGTMARKGDSTETRPHRIANLIEIPEKVTTASLELINSLASTASEPEVKRRSVKAHTGVSRSFDLDEWLAKNGIEVNRAGPYEGGTRYILKTCPFNPSHTGTSAAVFCAADGMLGFKCQHSSCSDKSWADLRELKEPGYRDRSNGHKGHKSNKGAESIIEDIDAHLTPWGLARRLIIKHGENLHYCYEYGKWLIYDGKRWVIDSGACVMSLMKDVIRNLYLDAANEDEKERREKIVRYALSCERSNILTDALNLAQSEEGVPIKQSDLDTNPWLLNCQNGIVDLRTGDLLPHHRKQLITKLVNLNYNPEAECHTWLKVLRKAVNYDQDLEYYLQRVFGYLLTGDVSECGLFFFYGPTKTAKTTVTGTVYDMLGSDYAKDTPVSTITVNKYNNQANDDLARLAGTRMVKVSETESGTRLATGLIKYLTGNESEITGKFLYHERFNFKPTFKLVMTGNYKPSIPGNDTATYERLHLIPFKSYLPPKDRIKNLREVVLKAEHEGILTWCVKGCLAYVANGDLGKPKAVVDEVKKYQKEMDTIGQWLDDCCEVDSKMRSPIATLFASYQAWCIDTDNDPGTVNKFSKELELRGFEKYRKGDERGREGIYVKNR